MTDGQEKRKLPWGKMIKWGGLYVLAMVTLATLAYALGLVGDTQSELIGKAIGGGLVAVMLSAAATAKKD